MIAGVDDDFWTITVSMTITIEILTLLMMTSDDDFVDDSAVDDHESDHKFFRMMAAYDFNGR